MPRRRPGSTPTRASRGGGSAARKLAIPRGGPHHGPVELNVKALLQTGRLSPEQVEQALRSAARDGGPLVRCLRDAADLTDDELCDVIARVADLTRTRAEDLRAVDFAALALVPADLCELVCAIPVRLDAWGALVVAMADPFDEAARAELEFAAGRSLRVELATEAVVREAIARLCGSLTEDDGGERQFLDDDDDLRELYAAADAAEDDVLEVVEVEGAEAPSLAPLDRPPAAA